MSTENEQPRPESPVPPDHGTGGAADSDETVTLVWPARQPVEPAGGNVAETSTGPREGLALGPVVLVRAVGRGGMGVVWLGHHQLLGRQVAVKFLTSAFESDGGGGGGEAAFARFLAEARAAAAVRHPNLVPVYDAGLMGRTPYLVMEYVAGPTLRQVLKREGRLDLPTTLLVLEDVAAAVDELHRQGVIHRDLKPANVLMDRAGTALVSDFGLALRRPHGVGSSAGPLAGTPAYMSPEAFAGEASARGDVYALGITVFEMLAGAPPFDEAEVGATREAHVGRPLPVERLRGAGLADAVVDAIERAAHKRALFRYKTAADLLRALREAAAAPGGTVAEPRKRALLAALVGRCQSGAADTGPGSGAGGFVPSSAPAAADSATKGRTPPSSGYFETIARLSARKREQRQLAPDRDGDAAGGAVVLVEPEPERLPDGAVGRHVPCLRCGYDLRAAPAAGRCPECAAPVADSLRLHDAVLAPATRRALRRFMTVLCVAAVFCWMPAAAWSALRNRGSLTGVDLHLFPGSPAGVLASIALDAVGGRDSAARQRLVNEILGVAFPLLIAAASLMLSQVPGRGGRPGSTWRRTGPWLCRVAAGGLVVGALLIACAAVASPPGRSNAGSLDRIAAFCLLGLAPLTYVCLARAALLGRMLGRPWIASLLRITAPVVAAGAATATVFALVAREPGFGLTARFPPAEAFAWLAHVAARALDVVALAAGAGAVTLLLRLRRHLIRPPPPPGPIPVEPVAPQA